jgi:hypothetical protein
MMQIKWSGFSREAAMRRYPLGYCWAIHADGKIIAATRTTRGYQNRQRRNSGCADKEGPPGLHGELIT